MKIGSKKSTFIVSLILTLMISTASLGAMEKETSSQIQPMVVKNFFKQAKKNNSWKVAFATAEHEQVVFMNISPITNPKNEIGMEVHKFDQVILIVEGSAKAILNNTTSLVKEGDMIFIPKGTEHNVINKSQRKKLKLISFYSDNDIIKGAEYKKKSDEPKE
ncbi:MAG: cupin domain-containing protein [Parachlamydiales bacterium]|nr:cupin domain-containing protein [Parachlamydiales bacterium]